MNNPSSRSSYVTPYAAASRALAVARATCVAALFIAAALLGVCHRAHAQSPAPITLIEYDASGNLTRSILAPGAGDLATSHQYDTLQRRTATVDARNKFVRFQYNGRGDLVQVTDPRSLVTQYTRSGFGDNTALASPDTGATSHTFDAAGNLRTRTDSRGVVTTYQYDALNRMTSATHVAPGGASEQYAWAYDQTGPTFGHGVGRLTSMQYPSGSTSWAYDALGRVVSALQVLPVVEQPMPLLTRYGHDAAGRVTSITYPSGRVLTIAHVGGLPNALAVAPQAGATPLLLVSGITHQPSPGTAGPVRSWNWHLSGGTQAHERIFDAFGRMVRHPLGGAVRNISYDAADRITGFTHFDALSGVPVPALNQSFSYDETGRLTQVSTSQGVFGYAHDDNGNRVQMSAPQPGGQVTKTLTVEASSNRLLALTNPTRAIAYDAAGNTLTDQSPSRELRLEYGPAGRVATASISENAGSVVRSSGARFSYNGFGQRVTKIATQASAPLCVPQAVCAPPGRAASVIAFVYDLQGRLLGEYDVTRSTVLREYVWLQDMPVAVLDGPAGNPSVAYIYTDHLGTPRVVIDREGRQRWAWVAEPFGDAAPVTNPMGFGDFTLNLRMPGQYFDVETKLAQNWHRDYAASLGRYTQSDPIGLAGGINPYVYVENNPLSWVDPDGLAPMPKWWTDGWKPTTPPGNCATAECAAGVLPTPKPNPTECEMQCGLGSADAGTRGVVCAAVAQGGKLFRVPGIPVTLACKAIDKRKCIEECEEKKKCP